MLRVKCLILFLYVRTFKNFYVYDITRLVQKRLNQLNHIFFKKTILHVHACYSTSILKKFTFFENITVVPNISSFQKSLFLQKKSFLRTNSVLYSLENSWKTEEHIVYIILNMINVIHVFVHVQLDHIHTRSKLRMKHPHYSANTIHTNTIYKRKKISKI